MPNLREIQSDLVVLRHIAELRSRSRARASRQDLRSFAYSMRSLETKLAELVDGGAETQRQAT